MLPRIQQRWPRISLFKGTGLASSCQRHTVSTSCKPFYITTPIFYVNAKPHIGHLYTLLLTDVMKRYHGLMGRQVFMLTGTDEHGMKIQAAAEEARQSPLAFCDAVSQTFRALPEKANIQYDHFIRTTSTQHKAAVVHFWERLRERGYIYKAMHSGWYSVSDETFFPVTAVATRTTQHGTEEHFSLETGNIVTWTQEENYHFRLSHMKDALLQLYHPRHGHPAFITPKSRLDDVIQSVSAGDLQDFSISRPASRLSWGIRVPGDETQTVYVWFDALINYITAAGYPATTASLWPADIHVIGKDIVRFHCIYWPAMLMAADLPCPARVVTHAHWTMGNYKMSKSRGNVADPWTAIDRFGVDAVRYYLMRDGRLESDGNYSTEHLILRNNHELVNGLGNLVSRITPRKFKLAEILQNPPATADTDAVAEVQDVLGKTIVAYHRHMSEQQRIDKAIAEVVRMVDAANAVLQHAEPWSRACDEETRRRVLYACLECARCASLLLQPVMPTSMARLLDRLGVAPNARTLAFAKWGADAAYRPLAPPQPHVFLPFDDGSPSSTKQPKLRLP